MLFSAIDNGFKPGYYGYQTVFLNHAQYCFKFEYTRPYVAAIWLINMFLSRVFGRRLCTAVRSEASAAATATSAKTTHNPLEEFFEADRSPDEDKPVVYGNTFSVS